MMIPGCERLSYDLQLLSSVHLNSMFQYPSSMNMIERMLMPEVLALVLTRRPHLTIWQILLFRPLDQ